MALPANPIRGSAVGRHRRPLGLLLVAAVAIANMRDRDGTVHACDCVNCQGAAKS